MTTFRKRTICNAAERGMQCPPKINEGGQRIIPDDETLLARLRSPYYKASEEAEDRSDAVKAIERLTERAEKAERERDEARALIEAHKIRPRGKSEIDSARKP